MKRLLTLSLVIVVSSGCCRGEGRPIVDPFFPYTRVPPPGTGSFQGGPTDPYYPGTPGAAGPSSTAPATPELQSAPGTPASPSGGGSGYGSPGTPRIWGDSADAATGTGNRASSATASPGSPESPSHRSLAAAASTQDAAGGPDAASGGDVDRLAAREPVIQILHPRPRAAEGPSGRSTARAAATSAEPRRLNTPSRTVDIMDLPEAAGSSSAAHGRSGSAGSGFRLVTGDDEGKVVRAGGVPPEGAAEFTSPTRYGHDPQYRWLRGKLEYSQMDRQWKLRYIPIDGETDDFGGSVVLPDPAVLAGYERGEFVEVRGRVSKQDPPEGFAPTYEVAELKRLTPD